MRINQNEVVDILNKNLKIIQKKDGFKFGIDSVLISHFVEEKKYKKALDIGSGSGIISFLLYSSKNIDNIVGIDIQSEYVEMANRSVEMNSINNIKFINADLCFLDDVFNSESFDMIISNPPYFENTELISPKLDKAISRFEIKMNMDLLFKNVSYALKNKGDFYLVHRPSRLNDILTLLIKHRLEPKTIRFVYPNFYKNSNIVLIKAVKNAKRELKVLNPLYVYDNGSYTDEINEIYSSTKIER